MDSSYRAIPNNEIKRFSIAARNILLSSLYQFYPYTGYHESDHRLTILPYTPPQYATKNAALLIGGLCSSSIPPRPRISRVPPRLRDRQRPQPCIINPRTGQGDGVDVGVVVQIAAACQFDGPDVLGESVLVC